MAKEIKVEWCENFIKSKFKKLPDFARGFETNCFFKMAAAAGLYTPGTYGSPMSQALALLHTIHGRHYYFAPRQEVSGKGQTEN